MPMFIKFLTIVSLFYASNIWGSQRDGKAEPGLKANLTIGTEDDDLLLGFAVDIAIGEQGTIFILDIDSHRILKFSRDGALLAELGGEGQGPGEITLASGLGMTIEGNLIVADMGRRVFSILDQDGAFIGQTPFPSGVVAAYMPAGGTGGTIGYSAAKMDENYQPTVLWLLSDQQGKILAEVYPNPYETIQWEARSQPGWYADFLRIQFEAEAGGSPRGDWMGDRFVVCRESQYAGTFIDAKGNVTGQFKKKHKPMVFSEDARYAYYEEVWEAVRAVVPFSSDLNSAVFEKALSISNLPMTLHPISRIFATETGFGILSNYNGSREEGVLHFFDAQGRFLQELDYEGPSKVFKYKNGSIYAMGYDQDGNNRLVRYEVKGLLSPGSLGK